MKLLLLLFLLLFSSVAFCYPNFIGYGYQSCMTCHYNPLGNGPLTDYGRGLGATVISDRLIYSEKTTDDSLGRNSGFLYREPLNDWLRPSASYRGLLLKSDFGTTKSQTDIIHMVANINLVLRLGPKDQKDKFFMTATFGYAPTPRSDSKNTEPNYRSREHYLGYRITEGLGIYLGLMDKAFGIRVPDHISYGRSTTSNTMNDQTHGAMLHFNHDRFEVAGQYFVGNLDQKESIRQKGLAARAELSLSKKARIGASIINSKSNFLKNTSMSLHSKTQFGKGSSVMLEIGQTTQTIISKNTDKTNRYLLLQNHLRLKRGLHALVTGEYFSQNIEKKGKIIRIGPGLQYFPFQSVEVRFDLYNSRIFSETSVSDDQWDLAGQIHLWF